MHTVHTQTHIYLEKTLEVHILKVMIVTIERVLAEYDTLLPDFFLHFYQCLFLCCIIIKVNKNYKNRQLVAVSSGMG